MKKIYRFVLKSFMGPMVLTFFIALFILLMQFLWKYVDDMVGKGFEWYVLAELMFYASATFVPMALPLAVLLASLMTFGNLGEHYELVAIKAAGISFSKALMPLVVFIVLLSGLAFYFSNNILPIANLKYGVLLFDIREKKPALNINEGIFYNELEGYVIRIGKKDKNGADIQDVMIYDHTDATGNNNVTLAEKGRMESTADKKTLIFMLYNGYNYYEPASTREHR
ncbi:MAG TPA: LptF/LptG family permease, partial [Bacteroidales bacterium]|nr:LptF/LptG family permease [Bacteroidales bacterium]